MTRVLIIEDEPNIAEMVAYDLQQIHIEVDIEKDGYLGYKKALSGAYDIILLDLMLPSMNGVEVCKRLRKENIESHIIMLTAMDDEFKKVEGFSAGADDYVTKPFSPRELTARVKAVVRRLKPKEEVRQASY